MVKVVFDSSFLMALAQKPTGWSEDMQEKIGAVEPVLLRCIQEELERLASAQGRKAILARAALEISKKFEILPCHGAGPDEELVSAALGTGSVVATVDGGVMVSLKALKVKVVTLRSGRVAIA